MSEEPDSRRSKKRGPERSAARKEAERVGLYRSKMWKYMQIAEIPEDEFEALLESTDLPPTTSQLIEYNRRRKGRAAAKDAPRRHTCPHCGGDLTSARKTP